MEVISRRSSSLNPNAPIYVPHHYRTVENFSREWWQLIHSSGSFRDYWLQERFDEEISLEDCVEQRSGDPENDFEFLDAPELVEIDDDFGIQKNQEDEVGKEIVKIGSFWWTEHSNGVEKGKKVGKAPKIVNHVRVNPRQIHQPR